MLIRHLIHSAPVIFMSENLAVWLQRGFLFIMIISQRLYAFNIVTYVLMLHFNEQRGYYSSLTFTIVFQFR